MPTISSAAAAGKQRGDSDDDRTCYVDGDYEQHLVADTTRIRQELGYREVVSREEGLRRAIAWERAHRPQGRDKLFDYAAEDTLLREMGVAPGA